jgi:hypothetical protein
VHDLKKVPPLKGGLRFTSILEQSSNKLWGCHFRVPNRIVKQLAEGNSRRVVCTLNGSTEYQCAMLPHGEGMFVITVNKKLRDTLGLEFGTEVQVRLRKDSSEYGLPLPEELREMFRQDAEGNAMFHALTRGRQRTLLYIIGTVKSSERRIARASAVVNHLKANSGKINYKQLNAALKDPRREL